MLGKTTCLTVRLPVEMAKELRELAIANERSISGEARLAITARLAAHKRGGGPRSKAASSKNPPAALTGHDTG
jgi:hypothetical protein